MGLFILKRKLDQFPRTIEYWLQFLLSGAVAKW